VSNDRGRPITLQAADGQSIHATEFGSGDRGGAVGALPGGAIVIAPATGVAQGFYRAFATGLARSGVTAYTLDYRGIGRSRPQRLRGFEACFEDWILDIDGVVGHALAQHGRVGFVGHSIGGLLGVLGDHAVSLQGLALVGAQTAYWRDWRRSQRVPMALLWHGLMPLLTAAFGYFPGRALRLGEDLPRAAALQWASRPWRDPFDTRQCRQALARALPPVHLLAPSDDSFATAAALRRVQALITGVAVSQDIVEPASLGVRSIGHFGAFRPQHRALWPRLRDHALPLLAWSQSPLQALPSQA
jgi:predicted alpha/beta hydrolase